MPASPRGAGLSGDVPGGGNYASALLFYPFGDLTFPDQCADTGLTLTFQLYMVTYILYSYGYTEYRKGYKRREITRQAAYSSQWFCWGWGSLKRYNASKAGCRAPCPAKLILFWMQEQQDSQAGTNPIVCAKSGENEKSEPSKLGSDRLFY